MSYEPIRIDYDEVAVYTETDQNVVGATTDTTMRTIAVHADANCIYVDKTGDDGNAGTQAAPLLTIGAAEDACDGTHQMVTILDSGYYDEEVVINNANCLLVQADLGQTPTVTHGLGARITATMPVATGTAYYVNKAGDDGNSGLTEADAFLTIGQAMVSMADGDTCIVTDSGVYDEAVTLPGSQSGRLLAVHGQRPTIRSDAGDTDTLAWTTAAPARNMVIAGFTIDHYGTGHGLHVGDTNGTSTLYVADCTVIVHGWGAGGVELFDLGTTELRRLLVYHTSGGMNIGIYTEGAETQSITDCMVYGFSAGGGAAGIDCDATGATAADYEIFDCLVRTCVMGIRVTHANAADSTAITNCFVFNAIYNSGLGDGFCYYVTRSAGDSVTVTGCIAYHVATGTHDFYFSAATTIQYCLHTYADSTNETNNGTDIDGLPSMIDRPGGWYGLAPLSNGWHVGDAAGNYDMGPRWVVMALDIDNVELNGLTITGQNYWLKGVSHLAAQTGTALWWCSVTDFNGVAVDFFHGSACASSVYHSIISASGFGIAAYGGTVFDHAIIYRNKIIGVYTDKTAEIFDHVIFYGNGWGLYVYTNGVVGQFKNSITAGNSAYGLYSLVSPIVPMYCCIADPWTDTVDVTDASNFSIAPGFRDVTVGAEDFHLATVEGGYAFPDDENNPLVDAGDDGEDIGVYEVTRVAVSDTWESYTLATAPVRVDFQRVPIALSERYDTSGVYRSTEDAFQWTVTLTWTDDQNMDVEQRKKMEYLFEQATAMRLYFAPAAGMWTGQVVYDADTGRATPVAGSPDQLVEDEWKSWWMEFSGVTKPLKITSNTKTYWQLTDYAGAAPASGTYDAVITFMRVRVRKQTAVAPVQKFYARDEAGNEIPRTGFKIEFIEF